MTALFLRSNILGGSVHNPTFSIKQIISLSGQIYVQDFLRIFSISLVGVILGFPISWMVSSDDFGTHMLGLWLSPLSFVVNLLVLSIIIFLFDQLAKGESVSFNLAFQRALSRFWSYFLCSVVAGLLICLGFFLLILPGIYLSVIFLFAPYINLLDGQGVWDSLRTSKRMVKGDFWKIFGVYAIIIALGCFLTFYTYIIRKIMPGTMTIILVAVINVIAAVLWPLFVAIFYNLFMQLKNNKN